MSNTSLPSLTVLGSINIDRTYRVQKLPAPGETVLSTGVARYLGGKGANQAVAAARLGAATCLAGAVGNDSEGDFAIASLEVAGVNTGPVLRIDEPTGSALIAVDAQGENHIIVDPGANAGRPGGCPLPSSDVLLCQLEVDANMVEQAIAEAGGFVAINIAPATNLSEATLRRADLIVVNELEWEALPELRAHRRVVVTAGSSGASLYEDGTVQVHAPAWPVQVASTVGAGDAFVAAATIGFAAGLDAQTALDVAARVGAHAVSVAESQPPLKRYDAYRRPI